MSESVKDIPLWLKFVVASVAILGFLFMVYSYLNPNLTEQLPKVIVTQESSNVRNSEGLFLTVYKLSVNKIVSNIYIKVFGESVEMIDFVNIDSGVVIAGPSGHEEGFVFTNIPNAFGQYLISVYAKNPESLRFDYTSYLD